MATKVQKHMIAVNLKLGNLKLACEQALVANVEQDDGTVYLDNAYADVSAVVTSHQWAGYLSALEKEGAYKPYGDGFFGRYIKQADRK